MADPTLAADPAATAFYAVRLSRPYPIPGTMVTVPPGDSVVAAAIVDAMPADIVLLKSPAAA